MSLSVENLSFAYGAVPVLRDVSFTAEGGELVSVLGPNGVGESPYASYSAFAGNPLFIDLGELVEQGLLKKGRCKRAFWGEDAALVDYDAVRAGREIKDMVDGSGYA